MKKPAIQIWEFYDAPKKLRDLSTNGGDEDWLALIPKQYGGQPFWLQDNRGFGVCDISEYQQKDGSLVVIGCHA